MTTTHALCADDLVALVRERRRRRKPATALAHTTGAPARIPILVAASAQRLPLALRMRGPVDVQ